MNKPSFQRARTPAAKAERRSAILAAAALVLVRDGLDATSLNAIAAEAGVVKSNIYRYFESREEILMRLLAHDLQEISQSLPAVLAVPRPISDVAEILAGGLAATPRLCLLISITASTLERNISTDTLREIKREMILASGHTSAALRQSLPALSPGQAQNAVQFLFTLIAGLWPLSTPGPALSTLYQEPEFTQLGQDFQPALKAAIEVYLTGLLA